MKHLIDIRDLSVEELDSIMDTAIDIKNNPEKYSEKCKGKKLAEMHFSSYICSRIRKERSLRT